MSNPNQYLQNLQKLDHQTRIPKPPAPPTNTSGFPTPSSSPLNEFSKFAIVSEDQYCARIGREILEQNENAVVDAAIAACFCTCVTAPQASGLGGGLFMTICSDKKVYALNAREKAPTNAKESLYEKPEDYAYGGKAVGVPGFVAGLYEAHKKFGILLWADLIKPSRILAQNGFEVSKQLGKMIEYCSTEIKKNPGLLSEFTNHTTGNLLKTGDTMKRSSRFIATLKLIEDKGREVFYKGELAGKILNEVNRTAKMSYFTNDDLSHYQVDWHEAFSYRLENANMTVHGGPFPSSSLIVALALGILDKLKTKIETAQTDDEKEFDQYYLAEVLKFSAAHRSQLSDSKFSKSAQELTTKLLDEAYAQKLFWKIDKHKTHGDPTYYGATYAETLEHGTAQVSVLSKNGDAVSISSSINWAFGACFRGEHTGIIYNNQMADFSYGTKGRDGFGFPINKHNLIEPGKRPASSMAPIILLDSFGKAKFVTGGSGGIGIKILPAVIGTTWRAIHRKMDLKKANDFPRIMPVLRHGSSELKFEQGFPVTILRELVDKGYNTELDHFWGSVSNIHVNPFNMSIIEANGDFRKSAKADGI